MNDAPRLQDFQPGPRSTRRRASGMKRRAAVSPGDAFRAGFFGGLGLWCAFLFIQFGAVAVLVVLAVALGGFGALVEALL